MSYRMSFNKDDLQMDVIHGFLTEAYWSKGISRDILTKAIAGSVCVGCFGENGGQVGFARVVTDKATFAYLADVFVLPEHAGQGLAREMVKGLLDHQDLQGLRRWMLATADAHGVYEKLGFENIAQPEIFMEINDPDIYQR